MKLRNLVIFEPMQHNYFIYITTNPNKTTLYIGVTNDLKRRLFEHQENKEKPHTFAGKYFCYNLLYYEHFQHIEHAIDREKQLKKWSRKKKETLINSVNPNWHFMNDKVLVPNLEDVSSFIFLSQQVGMKNFVRHDMRIRIIVQMCLLE